MRKIMIALLITSLLVACTKAPANDTTSADSNVISSTASQEGSATSDTSSEPQKELADVLVSPENEIVLPDGEYYNGLNDIFVATDAREPLDKTYAFTINSVEELQGYYESFKDVFNFDEFKTKIDEFDEEYFKDKSIVLVAFSAGQSFIDHSIHSVEQKDGKLNIDVVNIHEKQVPAKENQIEWHLILKLDKVNMSSEKINVTNWAASAGIWDQVNAIITEIYDDYFVADDKSGDLFVIYADISHDYCVGDTFLAVVEPTYRYREEISDEESVQWHYGNAISVEPADFKPNAATGKPVIYIYPTEKTDVTVKLDFNGKLGYTYPKYDGLWEVTAHPDGTLVDADGRKYKTLFWDGWSDVRYDLSKGFCVKGEDTEEFLREKLSFLGLNEAETEEFLEYWLKFMVDNKYNVITFQDELYKETAKLTISPEPDTIIRVFMAFAPSEEYVELEPQQLTPATRNGYTVVEWGGTMQ